MFLRKLQSGDVESEDQCGTHYESSSFEEVQCDKQPVISVVLL